MAVPYVLVAGIGYAVVEGLKNKKMGYNCFTLVLLFATFNRLIVL
jgi:hypothetical protein